MQLIFNGHNQLTLIYDTGHPPSKVLECEQQQIIFKLTKTTT